MYLIRSGIEGKEAQFGELRERLQKEDFTLANWEYDKGYMDRQLDDKAMVFLRLPIEVQEGELDSTDARVKFGTPFVLKHVYQTGNEENIGYYSSHYLAPTVNQFQEPIDKDAPLDPVWVQKAEEVLRKIEPQIG